MNQPYLLTLENLVERTHCQNLGGTHAQEKQGLTPCR